MFAAFVHQSYLIYLNFIQFRCSAFLSFKDICSSFSKLIIRVIFISAKKKMIRSNTSPIIAFVKDIQIFWNVSNKNLKSKSMCTDCFPVGIKCAVAGIFNRSRPDVTRPKFWVVLRYRSVFIYFLKKSFLCCFGSLKMGIAPRLSLWNNFNSRPIHNVHDLVCQVRGWLHTNPELFPI